MKLKRLKYAYFSLIVLFIITLFDACKDTNEDYIPYVPVNFTIDLNNFNELTTTGYSQIYENDGYAGVIVFCEYYDVVSPVNSIYWAYDAACTYEISDSCSLINEGNTVMATCPCCGSKYSLFDGYPISGAASAPLKYYNAAILNNRLHVSN